LSLKDNHRNIPLCLKNCFSVTVSWGETKLIYVSKPQKVYVYIFNQSFHFLASIIVLGLALSSITYWSMAVNSNNNSISSIPTSYLVTAQADTDNFSNFNKLLNDKPSNIQQNDTSIVKAHGHFANNQIKDNIVTWIEGGMWNLDIAKMSNNSRAMTPNMTAEFTANFTMIKPDGSLSHNHIINNFKSDNVIFAGNDIVITGTSDIHSDNGIEYSQVPITVHLMGKKVLGLMIDVNKTGGHFSGDNEMFGTMISGFGLDNSTSVSNGTTINDDMIYDSNDSYSTNMNSMAHMTH
jgi:hypothetical protein